MLRLLEQAQQLAAGISITMSATLMGTPCCGSHALSCMEYLSGKADKVVEDFDEKAAK